MNDRPKQNTAGIDPDRNPAPDTAAGTPNPSEPRPGERKPKKAPSFKIGRWARIVMISVLVLVGIYLLYSLLYIFVSPDRNLRQIYLIPEDAAVLIQSSDPVTDWRKFSSSGPWQALKQSGTFAEIAAQTDALDSMIHANKTLLSLVGKREILISLHRTGRTDWDFLAVVDMGRASKLDLLKNQIESIVKLAGFGATARIYKNIQVTEMFDSATGETLNMAFVDNHLVISYSPKLIEASIDAREKPVLGTDHTFTEVRRQVSGRGLCRVFINYKRLPDILSLYLAPNEYIDTFTRSMDFAGLSFNAEQNHLSLDGVTVFNEDANPYLTAFLSSGRKKMQAHKIMPARTAFYTNFCFDDADQFVEVLEKTIAEDKPGEFESYKKTRERLEKYFDISLRDNFLGWMAGEIALAQMEPGLLGREPETVLAIRATTQKKARENMQYIETRIRKRSPIRITSTEYRGYEINYVELKGFFRLFFGKLFDSFEKPYYTYIDDFVVMSNSSAALLSFIEDHAQKNLLKDEPGFKASLEGADLSSSIFIWLDTHKFYPQLPAHLDRKTWSELQPYKEVIYSFPQMVFQAVDHKKQTAIRLNIDYADYVAPREEAEDDSPEFQSDKELMSELKKFYVEKFEGNILRDYYPDGRLKSEAEIREGRRNGRYREFYESGNLRLRGRYRNDAPAGKWRYFTEDGKPELRQRF